MNRRSAIGRSIALVAAVTTFAAGVSQSSSPAAAGGINAALCTSTPARIGVPRDLGFETCFDGARLYVKATLDIVAKISTTGDATIYARVPGDASVLSSASTATFPDRTLLLPGTTAVFDIGSGPAAISLATDPVSDLRYTVQKVLLTVLPAGILPDTYIGFSELIDEFIASAQHYRDCLKRNGTIGDIGCNAAAAYDVTNALAVFAAKLGLGGFTDLPGIVDKLVGVLSLDAIALKTAYRHSADLGTWNASNRSLSLSAVGTPATDPAIVAGPTTTVAESTTTDAPSTLGTVTPSQPAQALAVGSVFNDTCVIAWPTAPQIGVDSIQMTTTCRGQPPKYLFVEILYGDPHLPVSPSHPTIDVKGHVVDIVTSQYGYTTLVVQADTVKVE